MCKNGFLAKLLGSQYLFEILHTSLTVKNSENVEKSGCFEKRLRWRAPISFRNEGGISFRILLGGRYLFEILYTCYTVKTSWHVVKT